MPRKTSLADLKLAPIQPAATEKKPAGGKRSNPAVYQQISAFVRRDLYRETKKKLLDLDRDFSDLLDELLERWNASGR